MSPRPPSNQDPTGVRTLVGRYLINSWHRRRSTNEPPDQPAESPQQSTKLDRRLRILVVSPYSIHPLIHGGAVRIGNLIRCMSRSCDVSLMVLSGGTDDPEQRQAYRPWCEHVFIQHLSPDTELDSDPWKLLPPAAARFSAPSVADRIAALVDAYSFDIVHLEFAELGTHVHRCGAARTVLTEHDIGFETQARQRALEIGQRFDAVERVGTDAGDGLRQERFEILACEGADQVHVMSDNDLDLLANHLEDSSHLRVIPNGVDTTSFSPAGDSNRRGALFVGSFPHLPNLDAFDFLMSEIWPEIRRLQPDAQLTVAGARPPQSVVDWDGRHGIRVVGEVDDVVPLYQQHRVLVVPLRAGSGTRLKILEAMACGLPVVSTTIGAEGLPLSDPPEIVLADRPDSIAREVATMLVAGDTRVDQIGQRERSLVEARFDWDVIARRLHEAHRELVAHDLRPSPHSVVETDPAVAEGNPDISVIITSSGPDGIGPGLIDGLARQQYDRGFEMIWVAYRADPTAVDRWREAGGRVVSVRGPLPNQGAMLNAGAKAARGRVLVFTSVNAVPTHETWLARLTTPFDDPYAPAAVQGGITISPVNHPKPRKLAFTRVSVRWGRGYGGIAFSVINSAMRRDIWESFPFPPDELLADRQWQRLAHANVLLILPNPTATVSLVWNGPPASVLHGGTAEGGAWRRLGRRYSVLGLILDLIRFRPSIGAEGRRAARPTLGQRLADRLRPFALFAGNRIRRSNR